MTQDSPFLIPTDPSVFLKLHEINNIQVEESKSVLEQREEKAMNRLTFNRAIIPLIWLGFHSTT